MRSDVPILQGIIGTVAAVATDLLHLSPSRAWAIASVTFQQSLRRRVLWITPLAILAVIAVAQLQRAADNQDAIRQTVKYCVFASGMLAVMVSIILACTNLPMDIDTKVIYTIVTKPATRLEIVLGKIIGFGRVSAALLLIMGIFSFGYPFLRGQAARSADSHLLQLLPANNPDRPAIEHYATQGLLHAKVYATVPLPSLADGEHLPNHYLEIYAPNPETETPQTAPNSRWIEGKQAQSIRVPYDIMPEVLTPPSEGAPSPNQPGLIITLTVPTVSLSGDEVWHPYPNMPPTTGPSHPLAIVQRSPLHFALGGSPPGIWVEVLDANGDTLINHKDFQHLDETSGVWLPGSAADLPTSALASKVTVMIPASAVEAIGSAIGKQSNPLVKRIYVSVNGQTTDVEYGAFPGSVVVYSTRLQRILTPANDAFIDQTWPIFQGLRSIRGAEQLRGTANAALAPVGVYHFNAAEPSANQDRVNAEFRVVIERDSNAARSDRDDPTAISFQVYNRSNSCMYPPILQTIETGRTAFFSIPAGELASGRFDVMLRCLTTGHYLSLHSDSLKLVRSDHSFALNVFKSMFILWLLSLLVIIISVFCSTFLSWPIAIVLTLLLLGARWGVDQLSDAMGPELGRTVTTDLFPKDMSPGAIRAVDQTVVGLSTVLKEFARVLPDLSRFSALESIERGINIPMNVLEESALVTLIFGLSLTALAYLFLRLKEVAP